MNRLIWLLCPLLIAILPAAHGEEFGRLFYTPQQRQQLEAGNLRGSSESTSAHGVIMVNGVVQKQGGNRTVWINKIPQAAGRANNQNPASVSVNLPGTAAPVQLKVGEKLLLDAPAQQAPE